MASPVETLTAYYSAAAPAYERYWASAIHPASVQLIERLPLHGARRNPGSRRRCRPLLPALRRAVPSALIVGADRAEGMLRRSPAGYPRVLADAARLPFAAGSYDVVVMAFVLFHLPDPHRALHEVRRVLRAGGSLGVTTWGQEVNAPATEIWSQELDRHGAPPDGPLVAQHELMNTPQKLRVLLQQAGFH